MAEPAEIPTIALREAEYEAAEETAEVRDDPGTTCWVAFLAWSPMM
jgi:hypothetical protein